MRRTLNRPMFRRGGDVETPKRGLVDGPGSYAGLQDVIPTAQDIEDYRANQPEAAPDRSTSDFLINFGLDLISRSPTGNIFQTAATSAKEPFKAMQAARYAQEGTERDEYNDMFKAIMTAKSDMLSSEGGSKLFSKRDTAYAIKDYMTQLFTLQANQKGENPLTKEQYSQQQKTLMKQLSSFTGANPAVDGLFKSSTNVDLVISGIQQSIMDSDEIITLEDGTQIREGDHASNNPNYIGEKTEEIWMKRYNDLLLKDLGLDTNKANGGRINRAIGGPMMEETMTEETMEAPITEPGSGISFEELRQRLPAEITDDIIVILAESPAALVDFAEIQTQTDVDQFNMKYGVNLALPSGA
jgi:hypothetical protein